MPAPSSGATSLASARVSRLRERLRQTGAIQSSRSAISRHDALQDDLIVDVGEGKHPTLVEHLLARLEQHGLRRCLCREEGTEVYTAEVEATLETASDASASVAEADQREPYYYLCVPCELRLTPVSAAAASERMLQDVHYHFSSATHRRLASWMADPDIDATLSTSPLIDDPTAYGRAYVNGVPLLLSRRPGGGDLFFPLPHEADRVRTLPLLQSGADGAAEVGVDLSRGVFPPPVYGNDSTFWYRPVSSLFTQSRQVVQYDKEAVEKRPLEGALSATRRLWRRCSHRTLYVQHVSLKEYEESTLLPLRKIPLQPVLVPLKRTRLAKEDLARKYVRRDGVDGEKAMDTYAGDAQSFSDGFRVVYVQETRECVTAPRTAQEGPALSSAVDRCVVQADAVYRVGLVSSAQMTTLVQDTQQAAAAAAAVEHMQGATKLDARSSLGVQVVPLTQEYLSQLTEDRPYRAYYASDTETLRGSSVGASSLSSSTVSSTSSNADSD